MCVRIESKVNKMVNLNRYSLQRISGITGAPSESNRNSVISNEPQALPTMEENKSQNDSPASRSLEESSIGEKGDVKLSDSSDAINDAEAAAPPSNEETDNYLPMGPRLILIVTSLMLAVFCMALDNTIIAVAIPKITDDFHALNDVGWYASAYLLTGCAFQLLFGKFYTLFNVKWVLLIALFIFEVGSLVCAVAPSSMALIIGRAVAGLGSAGIFTGAFVVIAHTVALERRPAYLGIIGGMYGVASVAGPLVSPVSFTFRLLSARKLALTERLHLDGRCFYPALDLAMVFLHQSANRRCHRRRTSVFAQTQASKEARKGTGFGCTEDAGSRGQFYFRSCYHLFAACAAMGRSDLCLVKWEDHRT